MLIFAFGAHPLLAAVFGKSKAIASSSLLPLGAAFTVLAATYLAVQYMLALKRVWFLPAIGLVAAIEPVLLLQAPKHPASFATVVLLVQLLGALVAYAIALSRRPARRAGRSEEPELLAVGRRRLPDDRRLVLARRLLRRRRRLIGRGGRPGLGRRRARARSRQAAGGSATAPAGRGGPSARISGIRRKSARSISSVEGVYSAAAG